MQGPPMDLKSQISAIINESERGQSWPRNSGR